MEAKELAVGALVRLSDPAFLVHPETKKEQSVIEGVSRETVGTIGIILGKPEQFPTHFVIHWRNGASQSVLDHPQHWNICELELLELVGPPK
jgi:hypothetical protein